MQDNALLDYDQLPPFSRIKPEHIEPAIDHILADNRQCIDALLKKNKHYPGNNPRHPLEELDDRLSHVWSPASHLHSVTDNEELRRAYNNCLPRISDYTTDMGQNEGLHKAYEQVANSEDYRRLSQAQQKIIDYALREFRLSGIALDKTSRKQFKEIQQKLSRLQTRFEENLLDATHAWKKHITGRALLSGLPDSAVALEIGRASCRERV